jgi:mannitol-1-phosphate/altronate dehydrogenase
LACENEISSDDLRESLKQVASAEQFLIAEAVAKFVPCVVDRICGERIIENDDRVLVPVERFGRLTVPDRHVPAFLRTLNRAGSIAIVQDIALAQMKKKWLVNGPHLLLAINALYEKEPNFQSYVRNNREVTEEILLEFSLGLFHIIRQTHPELSTDELRDDLQREATLVQQRFENFPDSYVRIAARFRRPTETAPNNLQNFFHNLEYKIAEPCNAYFDSEKHMPHRISRTLLRLTELIAHDKYVR